jgi:hypothetical protein
MRDLQRRANSCNTLIITRKEGRSAVRVRSSVLYLEIFGRQLEDSLDLSVVAGEAAERLELRHVDASVLIQLVTDVETNHPADDQMVGAELEYPVQKTLHAQRRLLYPRSRDDFAWSRSETRLLKLVGLRRMGPRRLVHRVREGQGYDVDHELTHLGDVTQGIFGIRRLIRARTHAYAEHGWVAGGHRKEAEWRQVMHAFPANRRGPGYRTRDHRADQQLVAALRIQGVGIYDQLKLPRGGILLWLDQIILFVYLDVPEQCPGTIPLQRGGVVYGLSQLGAHR